MNILSILLVTNSILLVAIILLLFKMRKSTINEDIISRINLLYNLFEADSKNKISLRQEQNEQSSLLREELGNSIHRFSDVIIRQITIQNNEQHKINEKVENTIKELQKTNDEKLDNIRLIVEDKLNLTISRRFDESFKVVGERLEVLYKNLGEIKALSGSVDNLNKILTNVKIRGTWGEVQLGALLEQIMAPEQYEKNVQIKRNSKERVDFAIKLPGKELNETVWLPVDAKFALEDYLKLCDENSDTSNLDLAMRSLEQRVKQDARSIRDKYIYPPYTTDFAIMFIPTESLYAEILKIKGLSEYCQNECKIIISGPTTLAALLNSLRVGFATLAIERKSSEVWKLLGAIKRQYQIFDNLIEKSIFKLTDAQTNMINAQNRSKQIINRLNKVDEIDFSESEKILSFNHENGN